MKRRTKYQKKIESLRKKSIKKYFKDISKDTVVSNKNLWNVMKPFLINEDHLNGVEIIIKCGNKIVTERSVLAEMFNSN